MKKNKFILASVAALIAVSPVLSFGSQAHAVQAADNSVVYDTLIKTVMHTAVAYNKDGKKTNTTYHAYNKVLVDSKPVTIKGDLYYKIADKDNQYVKTTNIDGVTRKITRNAYIYKTATKRTSYNGRWKLYKGQKVTTYGGSYKFKNGKRYFRIGGPAKQYVKSSNLGSVISPNASTNNKEETTVTVTAKYTYLCTEVPGKAVVQVTKKRVKKGDKFVVDRLEQGSRAGTGQDGDDDNELAIYHIKGTKYWIYSNNVQAAKQLPVHDYNKITSAYITFPKDTDVYNADGTIQDHNGQKISRQKGWLKVDKLVYIWVPSENKAELFYHLVGTSFYASTTPTARKSRIEVGHNAYVKANDVKAIDVGLKLTPSNTAAEAEAAAKKVKLKC